MTVQAPALSETSAGVSSAPATGVASIDSRAQEAFYRRTLAPTLPALHGLGVMATQSGATEAGLAFFRVCCELAPQESGAWLMYGQALIAARRFPEGVDALRRALGLQENAEALVLLGLAYQGAGNSKESARCHERATELFPDSTAAWNSLGIARADGGAYSAAAEAFRRSLSLDDSNPEVWNCLSVVLHDQGLSVEGSAASARARALDPESTDIASNGLFYLNCSSSPTREAISQAHRDWAAGVEARQPSQPRRGTNGRASPAALRVGFVSGDFRNHPVAYFLAPLLANRTGTRALCYSSGSGKSDEFTQRLKERSDGWRDISRMDDEAAARVIESDGIDILVDLGGHTADARLGIFLRRPAPIQVSYLGYPNTTGLKAIDYRISDELADPTGVTDHLFTETLVRPFSSFLCYEPPADAPAPGLPPCIREGTVTFGSFNHLRKVDPKTVGLWSRLLLRVPNSRLLLKSLPLRDGAVRNRVVDWFERHGVSRTRIQFEEYQTGLRDHLSCYARIDIALDTFPYNGATTTCEALWMGVPTVTRVGDDHRSRVGLSILTNAGVPELAATTDDDFTTVATSLAADVERLRALRGSLRDRVRASNLTDAAGFTRAVEAEFRRMWARHAEARPGERNLEG